MYVLHLIKIRCIVCCLVTNLNQKTKFDKDL